jgi:tRNA-uridine 2-sulfurtransferase
VRGQEASVYVAREQLFPAGARVLVGLSGGVDSAVAAVLLKDLGFDVVGVTLHLWEYGDGEPSPSRCCAPEDIDDARRTAATLGIPFFTFDRREAFEAEVVSPFVESYLEGTTPSPCVACNREVKIGAFVGLAKKLGAVGFATGHYARAGAIGSVPALLRGLDRKKDQSYFLHGIGAHALSMLATPLGALTKPEVRAIARERGLPVADKPDSEDLCFTAGNHAGFVERRAKDRIRPGPIVDAAGRVVGQHDGIHRFTVGQRRGLGVAMGHPAFVASIDAEGATVHLGELRDVEARGARLSSIAWLDTPGERRVTARIRYRHDGSPATVTPHERGASIHFDSPARAVTPGQICVLYDGDRVIAGGPIASAI